MSRRVLFTWLVLGILSLGYTHAEDDPNNPCDPEWSVWSVETAPSFSGGGSFYGCVGGTVSYTINPGACAVSGTKTRTDNNGCQDPESQTLEITDASVTGWSASDGSSGSGETASIMSTESGTIAVVFHLTGSSDPGGAVANDVTVTFHYLEPDYGDENDWQADQEPVVGLSNLSAPNSSQVAESISVSCSGPTVTGGTHKREDQNNCASDQTESWPYTTNCSWYVSGVTATPQSGTGTQAIFTPSTTGVATVNFFATAYMSQPSGSFSSSIGVAIEITPLPVGQFIPSINEAAPEKYRKVALNGRPLPDEKPQQAEETDQPKEETYIDAMMTHLRHSTTDIYVPLPGGELTLNVRRNATSDIHSLPRIDFETLTNRINEPFGRGWTSNICSYLRLTYGLLGNTCEVYDENGSAYHFVATRDQATETYYFLPIPSATVNEAYEVKLEQKSDGTFELTKKYGTKLVFEPTTLEKNYLDGSVMAWQKNWRLRSVEDRYHNKLLYQYEDNASGPSTLIPSTIVMDGHADLKLTLEKNGEGKISRIIDPMGRDVLYTYTASYPQYVPATSFDNFATGYQTLLTVKGALDSQGSRPITSYTYEASKEYDYNSTCYHFDVKSITDPRGKTYTFTYGFDLTRHTTGQFPQPVIGQVRPVTSVTLPDGLGTSNFAVYASIAAADNGSAKEFLGFRTSVVTDAEGNARVYEFLENKLLPWRDGSNAGKEILFHEKMKISHYRGHDFSITYLENVPGVTLTPQGTTQHLGTETFDFDIAAGGSVKKVTDLSGNVTQYAHTDSWGPAGIVLPVTRYSDPTAQTDALGHVKSFTYDNDYRVMTSVTDEAGRVTRYKLDKNISLPSLGRRVTEEIYPNNTASQPVRLTQYEYSDSRFPGFVTKKTVKALGSGPQWMTDLVTNYAADSYGRLDSETMYVGSSALTTSYTYDLTGKKLSVMDPLGHTTYFAYDSSSRLVRVAYPPAASANDSTAPRKLLAYDARGNKISETDENGHTTFFAYDGLNRLTQQARDMDDNGMVNSGTDLITQFQYNLVNSRTALIDPNGRTTSFEYDALQRLVKTTDPLGHITTFEYGLNSGGSVFDSSGFKPTRTVDPRGLETVIAYDGLYRPLTKWVQIASDPSPVPPGTTMPFNPYYSETNTIYDFVGNPVSVTDPLYRTTTTDYDALNRPVLVVNPDDSTVQIVHTSTGLKWKQIDELGRVTESEYDAAGRLVKTYAPAVDDGTGTITSPVIEQIYDAAGNVTATINPLGNRWDFTYDVRNRRTDEYQPAVLDVTTGQTSRPRIQTSYDAVGNVITVTDARGKTTDTLYDAANRKVEVLAPAVPAPGGGTTRPVTHMVYDANGNLVSVTDPNEHTTVNTYDPLNRLITTLDAAGILVTNEYDDVGNRTAVIDGKGQRTEFTYDGLNRLLTTEDPANKVVAFHHNSLNKIERVDSLGHTTGYGYDLRNRLTSATYSGRESDNRSYNYDLVGNLLSVTQSNTVANVAYTYDALNRQTSETSGGFTHHYQYDLAGNRLTTTYGGTLRVLNSTYDVLNRLATLTEGGRTTAYGYDLSGNIAQKTLPNGDKVLSGFDAINRTTTLSGVTTASAALYTYTYSYDLASNVKSIVEAYPGGLNNRTVTNTYDAINRLITEAITTGSTTVTTTYGYDDAHNRASKVVTGGSASTVTYTYNQLNQLTATSEGDSYTYDFNGNRLTRTLGGVTDTYVYDFENRLVQLVKNITGSGITAGTYNYAYDYRTRRIVRDETAAGGIQTQTVFSGGTSCAEYAVSAITGAPGPTPEVEYVRGSDYGGGIGGILYTLRGGVPSYTHENRRGDVIAKTDGNGSLTYQATYEAYGKRTQESGSTLDRQKANTKDEDPTGLLNEGFRYRDLETGTFITRDPLGFVDGPNMYAYVVCNPWTKFDPEGLEGVFTNSLLQRSAQLAASPNIGDRFAAMGYGLAGSAVAAAQSIPYMGRHAIPEAIGQAKANVSSHEAAGGNPITTVTSRVAISGIEAFTAPLTIPANADKIPSAVMNFPGNVAKDVNNFAANPSISGGYDLVEDAAAIYATAKLANSLLKPSPSATDAQHQAVDYSSIPDSASVGPGKNFTASQKAKFRALNEQQNGGVLTSDISGEPLVAPQQSKPGVKPPDNEAHVDHYYPASEGGPNSSKNVQIISRKENLEKSNKKP